MGEKVIRVKKEKGRWGTPLNKSEPHSNLSVSGLFLLVTEDQLALVTEVLYSVWLNG